MSCEVTVTLWLFNIAMENGPFIDDFPNLWLGFSMAMLNNQMVVPIKHPSRRSDTAVMS